MHAGQENKLKHIMHKLNFDNFPQHRVQTSLLNCFWKPPQKPDFVDDVLR